METPSGWFEIIRGPRPPSQKWPNSKQAQWETRQPPEFGWVRQPRRWNAASRSSTQAARGPLQQSNSVSSGPKMNPDERCAFAQLKVQRLEAALAAFGEESSPEKAALEEFLVRARRKPRSGQSKSG